LATVFISYRRSDSSGWVGRLYDRLESAFGAEAVFYDIDSIGAGQDFGAAVEARLSACNAVLVVIGPTWLEARGRDGSRRLDQPGDHVLKEIELALKRNVVVIPVLVGGAEMPPAKRLPASIAALAKRNAVRISDTSFRADMERLVGSIERSAGGFRRRGALRGVGYAAAAVVLVGLIAIAWPDRPAPAESSETPTPQPIEPAKTQPAAPTIDLEAILGEEKGIKVFCEGFNYGSIQMLMELRYGGSVVPECSFPNNVPFFNFVEAWCHGYTEGADRAVHQLRDEFLSETETQRRYDLCVARRTWENAAK
jgi:hypothetical protein